MDRTYREPDRAQALLNERLIRDIKTLRSRTLTGATLFGYEPLVLTTSPDQATITSVNAPSGRWTVDIEATGSRTVAAGTEVWHLVATAVHLDGSDYSEIFDVAPHARFGSTSFAGATISTMTSKGWLDADEPFILALVGYITNDPAPSTYYLNPLTWYDGKIILTPR